MNKTTVKVLIVLLLILDLILFALVVGPFDLEQEDPAVQVQAPLETQPTVPEATEPSVTTVPAETEAPETTVPEETTMPEERFALTFAGDCTFGAAPGIYYATLGFIQTVGDDLAYPFRNVIGYFEEDDFTMVNLEGVLADRGNPIPKEYNFRGPVEYAKILTLNSVEAVTLANNHTFDYGKKGYESTVTALKEEGVPFVERDDIRIVTTERGLTIGLYGMTYAYLDVEDMVSGIQELKEKGAELIIVAPHWGVEGRYQPVDEQIEVGHAAIDAGAHIVFGTHPHVLQPIEEYAGGIIYYSLGNFAFGGNGAPKDYDTAMIRQEVIRKGDGTIVLGQCEPIPASVSSVSDKNNFQPTPYAPGTEEYDRVLAKLNGTYE